MTNKEMKDEITNGLSDIETGRTENADKFFSTFDSMSEAEVRDKVMKGLDDVEAGRTENADVFFSAFKLMAEGDIYYNKGDYDNAEKYYREASNKTSKFLNGTIYQKLGLVYYNKMNILYAIKYFEMAISKGVMESCYYLANIYEQFKDIDGIEYDIDKIIELYRLASTVEDNNIKALAIAGLKRNEQNKLKI